MIQIKTLSTKSYNSAPFIYSRKFSMYYHGRHANIDQFYIKNPLGLLQIIIVHALPTMQVKQITNNEEIFRIKFIFIIFEKYS